MEDQQKENLHDTAALRALCSGDFGNTPIDDVPVPPAIDAPAAIASAIATESDSTDENFVSEASPAAGIDLSASPATGGATKNRKERANQFSQKQAHAVAGQFRKTAIPLLFAMGGLLWVIGAITLVMTSGAKPEDYEGNPLMANGGLFAGICFALGVALVGGAVFFHLEVRKAKKQQS